STSSQCSPMPPVQTRLESARRTSPRPHSATRFASREGPWEQRRPRSRRRPSPRSGHEAQTTWGHRTTMSGRDIDKNAKPARLAWRNLTPHWLLHAGRGRLGELEIVFERGFAFSLALAGLVFWLALDGGSYAIA